ncbi:uncharacterized protein [Ptychodera flava]|uniref:uncharacterized protein n=1 Tax=Ptychodera flava TaxID=63121 RepID=UPI00396A8685
MDDMSRTLNSKIDHLNTEVQKLGGQVKEANERISIVEVENRQLREKVDKLEMELDKQRGQSKRDNLIFYGMEQSGNESWEQSEEKVQDYIKDTLNIEENIELDRVHRLYGSKAKPQPIIAKFSRYKDRVKVLKAWRQTKNITESRVRVGEDFSDMVKEKRRKMWPTMNEAIKEGKRATMRYDKLIIEGEIYIYDDKAQDVVRISQR